MIMMMLSSLHIFASVIEGFRVVFQVAGFYFVVVQRAASFADFIQMEIETFGWQVFYTC